MALTGRIGSADSYLGNILLGGQDSAQTPLRVPFAIAHVVTPTATGDQTITTSDLHGATPVAALVMVSGATAHDSVAAHAQMNIGATDGTNQWCTSWTSENGQARTDLYAVTQDDHVIEILSPTDGAVIGIANFSSWTTNGMVINWTTAPASAYRMVVMFWAGVAQAAAGLLTTQTTKDTATSVNLGWRPQIALFFSLLATGQTVGPAEELSYGMAVDDGSATQGCYDFWAPDDDDLTYLRGGLRTGRCFATQGATSWTAQCAFTSTGIDVYTRDYAGAARLAGYLCIQYGTGANVGLLSRTSRTTTGDQTISSLSFTPNHLISLQTFMNQKDVDTYGDQGISSFGVGAATSVAQASIAGLHQHNVQTSNAKSKTDTKFCNLMSLTGGDGIEATLSSFASGGGTINYAVTDATARYSWDLWARFETGYTKAVSGVFSCAGVLARSTATVKAGSLVAVGSLTKLGAHTIGGVLVSAGSLAHSAAKSLSAILSSAGALSRRTAKGTIGTFSATGVVTRRTTRFLFGVAEALGSLTAVPSKLIGGQLAAAGDLDHLASKIVGGALQATGSVTRTMSRALSGVWQAAGQLTRLVSKSFTGSWVGSAVLQGAKTTQASLSGVWSGAGALTRYTARSLTGTVNAAGALVAKGAKVLNGTLAATGYLTRVTTHFTSGTLSSVGSLVRQTYRALSGALAMSGVLTTAKAVVKYLTGTWSGDGSLVRSTIRTLSGVFSSSGSLVTRGAKVLGGSLVATGGLVRHTARSLSGAFSAQGALLVLKALSLLLGGAWSGAGALSRQTLRGLAGLWSAVGSLSRHSARTFGGNWSSEGRLVRQADRSLSGTWVATGALAASHAFIRLLEGTWSGAGGLARHTGRTLVGAWEGAGTLARSTFHRLDGNLAAAATLSRHIERTLGGLWVGAGVLEAVRGAVAVLLEGVWSAAGTLTRHIGVQRGGSFVAAGGLTRLVTRALAGVWEATGDIIATWAGVTRLFCLRVTHAPRHLTGLALSLCYRMGLLAEPTHTTSAAYQPQNNTELVNDVIYEAALEDAPTATAELSDAALESTSVDDAPLYDTHTEEETCAT